MSSEITELTADYYDFGRYVDRQRWLTYYRQLTIVLPTKPSRVVEIGVGPGIVRAVLRDRGIEVVTVDINDSLGADYVADVRALPEAITCEHWDWVVCSRVLHHIPKIEIPSVLAALASMNASNLLVTVPREDLSVQFTVRRTAGSARNLKLSGGSRLKRLLRRRSVIRSAPSGQWMLDGDEGLTPEQFRLMISECFLICDELVLDDDPSHVFFVLQPKPA